MTKFKIKYGKRKDEKEKEEDKNQNNEKKDQDNKITKFKIKYGKRKYEEEKEEDKSQNDEKKDQDDDEEEEPLNKNVVFALWDLEVRRCTRAIRKPHLEARFQALKYRPVQFYTLSDEEKMRIYDRRTKRVEADKFPKFQLPPKQFRPPLPPEPPKPTVKLSSKKQHNLPLKKRKLNLPNNSNKGIVIKDNENTDMTLKKEEEEFNDSDEVFGMSKFTNMKKLCQMNKRFIKGKGIQNLKGKIYAVLHEGYDKVFQDQDKDAREPKRSFYEWVSDCKDLGELNEVKLQAVGAGVSVSRAITDIMFLMSENKGNEMGAKFQVFEDTLGWVSRDETSVVICRILELIRAINNQLRNKKQSEMAARKGKEIMVEKVKADGDDDDDDDINESFFNLFIKAEGDDDDDLKESFVDSLMHVLLENILRQEIFWVCKRLPCYGSLLIDVLPSLEIEVVRCDLSMMELEVRIDRAVQDANFGVVSLDWKETNEYFEVELKLDELWSVLEQ